MATAMNHPASKEFQALFPLNSAIVTTLDRTNTPPHFVLEGIVHGRYLVTMQLPLIVQRSNLRVTAMGNPSFILQEFSMIRWNANGQCETRYNSNAERRFGIEQWQRLVRSRGDLSVLGLKPVTNAPLPKIESYLAHGK
jgi:hypothetical protein